MFTNNRKIFHVSTNTDLSFFFNLSEEVQHVARQASETSGRHIEHILSGKLLLLILCMVYSNGI